MLANKGLRVTAPRNAVVEVLVGHAARISVADIHGRNLVSVYRTVSLLCRLGAFRVADESRGTQRFELTEAYTGHRLCHDCSAARTIFARRCKYVAP